MSTKGSHLRQNHHGRSYPADKLLPVHALYCKLRELTQKQKQVIKHRHIKKSRAFKHDDVSLDEGVSSNS